MQYVPLLGNVKNENARFILTIIHMSITVLAYLIHEWYWLKI